MQSGELYRSLIEKRVEVEIVLFPNAGHSITAPKQSKDVKNRWIEEFFRF